MEHLAFLKWRQVFQLTGLVASPDGLYDGSFLVGCARWWNHEVESGSKLQSAGYQPFSTDDIRRLCAIPQPENRAVLEGIASALSWPGRLSAAVLSLAYAFAVIVEAAACQVLDEFSDAVWEQARPFTESDITELERHYSMDGVVREYARWMPYWQHAQTLFPERVAAKTIRSLRATFDDQVDRWSAAEGFNLRRSIGKPDYSMMAADENAGLPNFVELLFEWGGRLRLGERLLAQGWDLRALRFSRDEDEFIDHLYDEAFGRFAELAAQESPVSSDIDRAIVGCVGWLGAELSYTEQLAIRTTATRGYLWRTVEGGPVRLLEPELSEAVDRSLTIGEGRSPDEPFALTLYYAAVQCVVDGVVNTRRGSIGGFLKGAKFYEKALMDTTSDFEEHGLTLDETTQRLAFQFGVSLADVERVLTARRAPGETGVNPRRNPHG